MRLNVGFAMNTFDITDSDETDSDVGESHGVTVPGPGCPGTLYVTVLSCIGVNLQISDVSEQRPAWDLQHGEYVLSGYFADLGSRGVWTAIEVISITPFTAVEAVS